MIGRSVATVHAGTSAPLGASVRPGGVNFSVFADHATALELLLFDDGNSSQPANVILLDAQHHRTYHYWHAFVPGLEPGQVYAYRAQGPFAPERGLRFDAEKVLLDPYGLAVAVPDAYDRAAARRPGVNAATAMKSVVVDPGAYDWEGDVPLNRRMTDTVIYELHVRGFTRDASSGVAAAKRGTYAGLIDKIPYLRRDGSDDNVSWNCGVEGPTDDATIEALRNRQVKNFFALELLAVGTPMLLMGDEVRRTQRGNNNAYCHDDEISWFDWSLLERHGDIHRFVKSLIAFRQLRDVVAEGTALTLNEFWSQARIDWHGVALDQPDWGEQSHSLAFTLQSLRARYLLHGMLNAYWEPLTFELPPVPADARHPWRRYLDTARPSPDDVLPWAEAAPVSESRYVVAPRAVVVLVRPL